MIATIAPAPLKIKAQGALEYVSILNGDINASNKGSHPFFLYHII